MRKAYRFQLAILGVAIALGVPQVARADNANSAAAQALFDQARKLMAQGQYRAACPKLEESQRLDPGSGTLINLADCYDHEGKTATSWSTFLEAAAASHRVGNSAREQAARARAAQLEPKLSKLVIDVAAGSRVPGLTVTRDGEKIDSPMWGTPVPIDPGTHKIVAKAPGHASWRYLVAVQSGPTTQTVHIPLLAPAAAGPPGALPQASPAGAGASDRGQQKPGSSFGPERALALVAGGVGIAGVAVGTVFGLRSKSKHDEAAQHCDGSLCRDQAGVDLKSEARSAGNVSTVAFIVGGVGLAGAAVLWLTAGSGSAHTQVGLGPRGVAVRGEW